MWPVHETSNSQQRGNRRKVGDRYQRDDFLVQVFSVYCLVGDAPFCLTVIQKPPAAV